MTDFKPQYQSDRLEIFEWPQPICELRDPVTGHIVSIRTPEDATAVARSLKQFLSITNPTKKVNNMSADAFIGAVKVKRDEAVEYFLSEDFHQALANGVEPPDVAIKKGLDQLVGGVLDVVNERYEDIIEGSATDSEGEEVSVSLTCGFELSTLYFEEVSN